MHAITSSITFPVSSSLTSVAYALLPTLAVLVLVVLQRRRRYRSLGYLQGPEPASFFLGNEWEIRHQREVGERDFEWMRGYGGVWRITGCLGEEQLMVADPKALQHILHTAGYHYPKREDQRQAARLIGGRGIAWAHGENHQRHRKILNPAFAAPQLKTFLPDFQNSAGKLVKHLMSEVEREPAGVINVLEWLSRATLDVIGKTGFNEDFGALDDPENPLAKAHINLSVDASLYPSAFDLFFRYLWHALPIPSNVLNLVRYLPTRQYRATRAYHDYMRVFARKLVEKEKKEQRADRRDILSLAIRANAEEDPRRRLAEYEMHDQIATLILTGHDTTSVSLAWFLWELAKDVEYQRKVRDEIRAARQHLEQRGEDDFSVADLENMTLLQAGLKESMRLHPIAWELHRVAGRDDVIPLAYPVTARSGERIPAIPVREGQNIALSLCGYNRMVEVWGPDADRWNPMRFVDPEKTRGQTPVGVYANLINFAGGVRGCIGWKFSVLEMHALAAPLVENFEFSLEEGVGERRIFRRPSSIMMPMAEGVDGAWMGLRLRPLC